MDMNYFIRILLRHVWLLVSIPLILALVVAYLTRNPTFEYETSTRIYTGLASGSDFQQSNNIDYFATSNAFDNLINVIQSRETLSEVSLRLLAQGLILDQYDPTYISKESFIELRAIVPEEVKELVVKPIIQEDSLAFRLAMDQTVKNFIQYKNASDTNFIYNILNYSHNYYSIKALSSVNVRRIQNSDLIDIKYKSKDPGISLQTLKILTDVFIDNYKNLKENISDVVVNYFEKRVNEAQSRLKRAEDELLDFTTTNNIINYNEQTKFIASKKETIEEYIQNEKMKLSGAEEAIKRLESKLQVQGQVQSVSQDILNKRDRLVEITEKITINELYNENDTVSKSMISQLKVDAMNLEQEIKDDLNKLYRYRNTVEGLPVSDVLSQWLENLVKYAEAKAGLKVLETRQQEFRKNYEIFAPLGSKMKRIEREIDVSEREYLSLLHSLNMAKLEQQNQAIGSSIKPVDEPYFPLSPLPTKRKILVIAAGLLGFILVLFAILAAEYFDNTIKSIFRAKKLTGLELIGIYPRFIGKYQTYDLSFILNRLTELIIQELKTLVSRQGKEPFHATSVIVVTSTQKVEGKSFICEKVVNKLRSMGEKVLYLNYTFESPDQISSIEMLPEEETGRKQKPKEQDFDRMSLNKDNILYLVDDYFHEKMDVMDLIINQEINTIDSYNFVFVEIPSILSHNYPHDIIRNADLSILALRANREWKNADQEAVNLYAEIAGVKPYLVLNATDINEVENKLGILPKRRSWVRKKIKQLINLQFYSRQSIK